MDPNKPPLAALSLILALGACTTVVVDAENVGTQPLDAAVDVYHENSLEKAIAIGRIAPKAKSDSITFRVRNGREVQVVGNLQSGPEAYNGGKKTVTGSINPFYIHEIISAGPAVLDPRSAEKTLSSALGDFGENIGFKMISVPSAVDTIWGALVCFVPDSFSKGPIQFPPQVFSSKSSGAFPYQSNNLINSVEINSQVNADLQAKVPIVSELKLSAASGGVDRIKYQLTGVGFVPKVPPENWDVISGLNSLSSERQATLKKYLSSNANARCMYVNSLYAIQLGDFDVYNGKTASAGMNVASAGGVISGGIAYTFNSTADDHKTYAAEVLNVDGPIFRVTVTDDGKLIPQDIADTGTTNGPISPSSAEAAKDVLRPAAVKAINQVAKSADQEHR